MVVNSIPRRCSRTIQEKQSELKQADAEIEQAEAQTRIAENRTRPPLMKAELRHRAGEARRQQG